MAYILSSRNYRQKSQVGRASTRFDSLHFGTGQANIVGKMKRFRTISTVDLEPGGQSERQALS